MTQEERDYKAEELRIRLAELDLKKAEFRRNRWLLLMPALVTGAFTVTAAILGYVGLSIRAEQEDGHARREFCYRAANDLFRSQVVKDRIIQWIDASGEDECPPSIKALVEEMAAKPTGATAAPTAAPTVPPPTCQEIKPIRDLGWTSGHKTRFCLRKGYDGVHNPFKDYSDGGYCYKGDKGACIAKMKKAVG